MEDAKIIDLFWARNEDAIAETDAAYGRKLRFLANKILNNFEDAEESVSDTYMKTWEVIPPQRPVCFYAFIASICRHLSFHKVDWNRAAKRNAEVVALTDEMELCIPDTSRDRELEAKELGRVLNAFLESLPKETRMIFLRRYNSYYAYTADMLDKIDEICEKYDLKLAGDTAVYQGNDASILGQILDFNSVAKEDSGLKVEFQGVRVAQCGDFNSSYNATLTNPSATQEFSFMLSYDYHDKAYFCTRYLIIGDGENVQQWNETLPDGTNVLIVNDKGGDAYILCDREDAFINITISKVGAEWANPGDVMTRGDMKLIAQALNYSVKPNPVEDMAALQKQLEEVWQSQEAIVIDPVAEAERQRKYEENTRLDSYGDLIQRMRDNEAYFVENCNLTYENFWDTMEYTLRDVNGDGQEELIFGRDGHICEIWTMQDGKTAGFMGSWYEGYLCEGNVYEDYVFLSGQPYHYYHRLGSGTEFSSILGVYYDIYYESWMLKDFESGTEVTQITEERAKEIMASFPRISLEMKPVREFPLD